jgi:hypothetical protein
MVEIPLSDAGPWRLVMPEELYEQLHAHLFPGDNDEHGAVIAAGLAASFDGGMRLLARDLHLAVDGHDYVPGKRGYRMLHADFVRDHILACRDERLVYLAVHNHGGTDTVGFSPDDFQSHERGYPALLDVANGMPVGALVFAKRALAGDIFQTDAALNSKKPRSWAGGFGTSLPRLPRRARSLPGATPDATAKPACSATPARTSSDGARLASLAWEASARSSRNISEDSAWAGSC